MIVLKLGMTRWRFQLWITYNLTLVLTSVEVLTLLIVSSLYFGSNHTLASKYLPVKQTSLTQEIFPTNFGNLCNVPRSAVSPMSTVYRLEWKLFKKIFEPSLTVNEAPCSAHLISVAQMRSIPPPIHKPWIAEITTFPQFAILLNDSCISSNIDKKFSEAL